MNKALSDEIKSADTIWSAMHAYHMNSGALADQHELTMRGDADWVPQFEASRRRSLGGVLGKHSVVVNRHLQDTMTDASHLFQTIPDMFSEKSPTRPSIAQIPVEDRARFQQAVHADSARRANQLIDTVEDPYVQRMMRAGLNSQLFQSAFRAMSLYGAHDTIERAELDTDVARLMYASLDYRVYNEAHVEANLLDARGIIKKYGSSDVAKEAMNAGLDGRVPKAVTSRDPKKAAVAVSMLASTEAATRAIQKGLRLPYTSQPTPTETPQSPSHSVLPATPVSSEGIAPVIDLAAYRASKSRA